MSHQLIEKILSDTASPSEQKEFEKWLNASEKNLKYFKKAKVIWNILNEAFLTKKFHTENVQNNITSKISERKTKLLRLKRFKQISYAASILVLIGLSYLATNLSNRNNKFTQIYTTENSIKEFELKDGSHVWLNKNSTLKLPENFSNKKRKVNLIGEAYFEVKPDEKKPFKVYSGKTIIDVLGTSFNINQDTLNGNVNLGVKTGEVAFYISRKKRKQLIVLADEQAQYMYSENFIRKLKEKDLNYLAWNTEILKFYETPLQKVCADLSKYYGVQIETTIQSKGLLLTGTFRNEELSNILSSIELTLDVKVIHQNQNYRIDLK